VQSVGGNLYRSAKKAIGKLPARLSRLARAVAIIFGRESASAPAGIAAPAATPAVPVAVVAASAPARATSGGGLGPRLVYFQRSPADFLAVQTRHGLARFLIVGHFDEGESASPARFPVHGDVNAGDLSVGFKERAQLRFGGLKIQIPDKQILHTLLTFKNGNLRSARRHSPDSDRFGAIVRTG